jgi:hypothetical protein
MGLEFCMRRNKNAILSMLFAAADAVGFLHRRRIFDASGFIPNLEPAYGLYGAEAGGDTATGAGGADTLQGDGGNNPPPVPTVPKSEADRAFQARDAAKKALKGAVAMLGYDPAHTKFVETGDSENPWRVEVDGEDVTEEFKGKKKQSKNQGAEALAAAEKTYKTRLTNQAAEYTKREAALIRLIDQMAVLTPLRAAFAANDGVDSGGAAGEYTDLVEISRKSLRTEIARDDEGNISLDEDGNATVTVTPLNADGTPMIDAATGKPVPINEFVKRFLDKRPTFKRNRRPGGAGAGGNGHGAPGGRPGNLASGAKAAGFGMFGLPAPGAGGG